MDFKNAKELLALCQEKNLPISEVMRQREILLGETSAKIVDQRMDRVLEIMKDAAFSSIKNTTARPSGRCVPARRCWTASPTPAPLL